MKYINAGAQKLVNNMVQTIYITPIKNINSFIVDLLYE